MRPLRSIDVRSIIDLDRLYNLLFEELADLEKIASKTDFDNKEHTDQFARNIVFLKTYYERIEELIRYGESK